MTRTEQSKTARSLCSVKLPEPHSPASTAALPGSGAIHEHGIIDRPTEDVDLFTTTQDVTAFSAAAGDLSLFCCPRVG